MGAASVGSLSLAPGKRGFTALRVGETIDGSAIMIPVFVTNGLEPGPTLYLGAAVHGQELTGIEIIRRIYGKVEPKELRGTIIACPVQNPLAVRARIKFTPLDYYADMNKAFPGKADGSLTERMAYVLNEEAISKADYVIDIHAGVRARNMSILLPEKPEAVVQKSVDIAKAFGLKVIVQWEGESEVPRITPELGESDRIEEEFVSIGVRGVMNVMKHIGMITGKPEGLPDEYIILDRWVSVRSSHGGLYFPMVKVGDKVSKGDIVARIYNIYTFEKTDEVLATENGYIVRCMVPSIVIEGERVVGIAVVNE